MDAQTENSTPRRLFRRSTSRMIGGVAGGLGDYTGLDPVIFRIGFIVLTVFGGAGVLLYACAWLLIPEEDSPAIGLSLLERLRARRVLAVVVVVVSSLFLFDWMQEGDHGWGVVWGVVLIAAGYVLLKDDPARAVAAADTKASATTDEIAAPAPLPRRRRSPLSLITLGAACVGLALGALLTISGIATLDLGQFVALTVMVIGLGLVAGAWWGRARWLAVPAFLLVPVMLLTSMVDVPPGWNFESYHHVTRRNVRDDYHITAGTATIDFAEYKFGPGVREKIDVSFFAGDVEIFVPPGVHVFVRGQMDAGRADLFGESFEGNDLTFAHTFLRASEYTEGTLVVNVDGGVGSFDTTWAYWVEGNLRQKELRRERRNRRAERSKELRQERRERRERRGQ